MDASYLCHECATATGNNTRFVGLFPLVTAR